ncbi:exo-beta-N-acetylmuramidase NamZ family protein [Mangrovimonas futianensis]|uniref:exo-beta-N-acetylmuramidase NamZ family protein n=1 Tax=Mangrovimonas futianensis TaxID=2895523 RepID=UPI001E56D52D|nr:DUF1343 domain-containing protein [Mangrovimonas futianensis]MCF1421231.1 DUF1343 domain-containing protein [Mangrovimonas futianensis]
MIHGLKMLKNTILFFVLILISCGNISRPKDSLNNREMSSSNNEIEDQPIIVGANRTEIYLPELKGKKVGIVANQTSVIFKNDQSYTHLVDSLVSLNVSIKAVFAPEHGFRGKADAGEHVNDGMDSKTGLPIISLYGNNKKPKPEQLEDIDVLVFDIQDVGARFYTYISTLHYVMEACAELNISIIILDRPNPNGHYVDGPILEPEFQSFVGMHPIPVVHGMTIGEYAQMINAEGWLKDKITCDLLVVPMDNYNHKKSYDLPIKPSPNLPNAHAINLYPSLCFFEGTNVNAGRGTEKQFQVFGSPHLRASTFPYSYTPESNEGAKHPKHEGKLCYGMDLSNLEPLDQLDLSHIIKAYRHTTNQEAFFNSFFDKLAGTKKLKQQIMDGLSNEEIRASWKEGLEVFRMKRERYLIYP